MTILKEQIREAARLAEAVSMPGDFNAMSWLDLTLEDDPQFFDAFFDIAWAELSEEERKERAKSIRKVL
jgi:4-oxalocrotonate tautomerase